MCNHNFTAEWKPPRVGGFLNILVPNACGRKLGIYHRWSRWYADEAWFSRCYLVRSLILGCGRLGALRRLVEMQVEEAW